MAEQYTQMKGEEFVMKILNGERDLSNIELEQGFDLSRHPRFDELNEYLRNQDLKRNYIKILDSKLMGLKAKRLYLPVLAAQGADLSGADLIGADLSGGNFEGADLSGVDLEGAYLSGANLKGTDLSGADLSGADLDKADLISTNLAGANLARTNFAGANLPRADLRNVKNLEQTILLYNARLLHTIVTKKERQILEQLREDSNPYDVREE